MSTPALLRLWRWLRVGQHIATGLLIEILLFPFLSQAGREDWIGWWARGLLGILGMELRIQGQIPVGSCLLVANHIGWIDIFVLQSLLPIRFVSKADVRRWPVIGALVALAGTFFLERGRSREAHRMIEGIGAAIHGGECVGVFPEGTTTDGSRVLPFQPALFQAAVLAGAPVQPVSLRYRELDGAVSLAPAYIDDISFGQSLGMIIARRRLIAEVHFLVPLPGAGQRRQQLAATATASVRRHLFGVDDPATDAGCGGGRGTL